MAIHSDILAYKIPWMKKPGRLIVHGVTKSRTRLSHFTSLPFLNIVNVNLDQTQLAAIFVRFFYCKVTPFLSFNTILFGKRSLCAAHTSNIGSYSSSPLGRMSICIIQNYSVQNFFFSLSLSYVINLHQFEFMNVILYFGL